MFKRISNFLSNFNTGVSILVISLLFSVSARVFALPYVPNDNITDPSCSFGATDCYVNPLAIGQSVASSTANAILFVDSSTELAEDATNFYFDNDENRIVVDNIRIPATDADAVEGVFYRAGSRFIHTFGTDNTFVGVNSGNFSMTTASATKNTALGATALDALTTGDDNVAVGYGSLGSNTTGVDNVAIGVNALIFNQTGSSSVAVGRLALQRNTGSYNTAVGTSAFQVKGGGDYNTGIGFGALYGSVTDATSSNNTALGAYAGASVSTGSRNTFLGSFTDLISATPTLSDSIALGYLTQIRASNQFVVGSETSAITDMYFGEGVISTGPSDVTLNVTGGSGTDIGGADLTIASGKGTGSAVGGDIIFSTSDVGASGTTLQTLSEKARLTYGGRFGIGTTTPDYEIEVSSQSQNIEIVGTAYGGKKPVFGGRSANGTEATPTASVVGDILAEFSGLGYGDTGFTSSTTGGMRVYAEQTTFTDSAWGTQLRFMTTGLGSTTLSQRMTITADGNVGIGDTTPDELLNISSQTNNGIAITSVGADVDPYIKFELVDGTASFTMGVDDSDSDNFKISTTGLGTSDRFIIDSSGNVNVGGDGTPNSLFSVGSTSQFQVSSTGSIDAVTTITTSGGVIIGSAGTGALSVGTTSGVYRTTNAGSNVTPQTVFDVDNSNSSAGSQAYIFDTNSGLVFTGANGTRRIARAAIDITNLTNTAGSETGDLAFFTKPSGSAITERLRIDASGEVGIGDTTPDYLLDVENTSVDTDIFALTDSDGACLHNPEAGAETVTCSSDERLKENIVDADSSLDDLMQFRIREYDVIASGDHMTGVIAQEVREIFPGLVSEGGNGYLMVTSPNTWTLVKAIQELKVEIDLLSSLDLEEENSLGSLIKTFLADAENTIEVIFAKLINAEKIQTEELCVGDVCITEDEFIEVFGNQQNNNQEDGGGNLDNPAPDEDEEGVTPPEETPEENTLPEENEEEVPSPEEETNNNGGEENQPEEEPLPAEEEPLQ